MADISQITLPSGTTYNIKDSWARQNITNNGTFVVAWNGASDPSTDAAKAKIPAGVVVQYGSNAARTGTLAASADTLKKFYLVHSSTQQDPTLSDIYDEYITVQTGTDESPVYSWEKIGDTQIKLSNIVTGINYVPHYTDFVTSYSSPGTAKVIGSSSTFTVTQPVNATTYLGAELNNAAVSASGDNVTVVTGYASPSTETVLKSLTVTKNNKLVTTTVTGVSGSTTASKVTRSKQTTATGGTATSTDNTKILANISVTGEVLSIGAVTLSTQDTYSMNAPSDITVPKAAASATTVATGTLATSGTGDAVVTNVTTATTADAITALGTPSTDTVLGTSSTISLNSTAITLSSNGSTGTGRVKVATGGLTTNAGVAWNSKDEKTVLTSLGTKNTGKGLDNSTTITATQAT